MFGCDEQAPHERTCCAGTWPAWSVWSTRACSAWRRSSFVILLRLYPQAWRERYEAEMLPLLEEHDLILATRFDLMRGAFDAWHTYRRLG